MKINKDLRNCYIKVNLSNVADILPIAKKFPRGEEGYGGINQEIKDWINHFKHNPRSVGYYVIDCFGKLSYTLNSTPSHIELLKNRKELTNYKQLQETLQERIKNFKV